MVQIKNVRYIYSQLLEHFNISFEMKCFMFYTLYLLNKLFFCMSYPCLE